MPLTVHLKGGAPPLQLVAPCLLPPLSSIVSVQVSRPHCCARRKKTPATAKAPREQEGTPQLRKQRARDVPQANRNPNPDVSPNPYQVNSPRYWARELQLAASTEHGAALRRRVLWVKRKTGHLGEG